MVQMNKLKIKTRTPSPSNKLGRRPNSAVGGISEPRRFDEPDGRRSPAPVFDAFDAFAAAGSCAIFNIQY